MARPDKAAVVTEVRDRLQASTATVLTEYRGLTVGDLARLRRELRKSGTEYRVAKNTLVRIAAREVGLDVPDDVLTGPTAVAFCGDDLVAAAKALRQFAKERPNLVIKGGILEGRYLDAGETLKLADLATREELLSSIAGGFEAILATPARLANSALSVPPLLAQALADKQGGGGDDGGEAEPAAA